MVSENALKILLRFREFGFEAYIVGGAVRDLMLGKTPKDFDIVTGAVPIKIKKIFRNSRIIGKRFRLVHVFFGDDIYEVSTFRSLEAGTIGNLFGTMDEDVQRRDFTLNALYYDPLKEQIIDYVGGVKDIRSHKIRPVIPLNTIFKDDPVRIVRAIKYSAITGFPLGFSLKRAIVKSAALLGPVSPSRLTEEIIKILNSGKAFDIVSLAIKLNVYMELQPAASAFISADPVFASGYLDNLKKLDSLVSSDSSVRLGDKLVFIIENFISGLTDWQRELSDNSPVKDLYNKTWAQCRSFVLPMNPPRTELEWAIRSCLKKLGISVRGLRFSTIRRPWIKQDAFVDIDGEQEPADPPRRRRQENQRSAGSGSGERPSGQSGGKRKHRSSPGLDSDPRQSAGPV